LGSATLSRSGSVGTSDGKFSIQDPSVTLTNFGYITSAGASFNSDLTLTASEIDFNRGGSASVVAKGNNNTPLAATISFTTGSVGHFTFTAGSVEARIGSFLKLDGTDIAFDGDPAPDGDFVQFGTLTASVAVGALNVTGTGKHFAIDSSGHLVTL